MDLNEKVKIVFDSVKKSSGTFPKPGTMKIKLSEIAKKKNNKTFIVPANTDLIKLFASGSVEMWLKSVHSFLISLSLTNVSALWASIAGYYSSHYTVRAIAHLLGYYQLRTIRRVVELQPSSNGFQLNYVDKRNREHAFYWEVVKSDIAFRYNDLFAENSEKKDTIDDASHRNFATYIDHLNKFENFKTFSLEDLKNRLQTITKMEINAYPTPNWLNYPDINNVQILAYHRLVFYRELIDDTLKSKNKFWNVHRNPSWCRDIINFQIVKPRTLEVN